MHLGSDQAWFLCNFLDVKPSTETVVNKFDAIPESKSQNGPPASGCKRMLVTSTVQLPFNNQLLIIINDI